MTTQEHEKNIRDLYHGMLTGWNEQNSKAIGALYTDDANVVGFDGSMMNGKSEIESTMAQIFADHQTASYVGIVREIRFLTADVAILRAVSGMIPPGQHDINPAVNTIQTLIAHDTQDGWKIALYHNTPAQFHGRPEAVEALSNELRQLLP